MSFLHSHFCKIAYIKSCNSTVFAIIVLGAILSADGDDKLADVFVEIDG